MIEKIRSIIKYYKMTDRAFAIKCGIKQNTFSNQLNGVRELSLATVNAILISFEEISSEWLLRGNGSMLLSEITPEANIEKMNRLVDTITILQGTINEKEKTIKLFEEKTKQLEAELSTLKNKLKVG